MKITAIDAFPLNLSFIPDVAPHMLRAATHGTSISLYRVRLEGGAEGWGDDVGRPVDPSAWVGRDALTTLRDRRHSGVQMACYDAVGRALDVPAHVLMGRQVRSRVPFAYWTIDLPSADLARQIARAASLGYVNYKFKCRPWWDPREHIGAIAAMVPKGFHLWLDFNGHLREARLALPVLRDLTRFECVAGIESPIPQRDIEGYKILRAAIDRPIVGHWAGGCCHVESDHTFDPGTTGPIQLREAMFDGFVSGGGDVDSIRSFAGLAREFHKPFWIQTVGTSLRAAWIAHLASTCDEAILSHLSAHDLWVQDVAAAPAVVDGWLAVPTGPGLGLVPDPAAIAALAAPDPIPLVRRVSTVVYPSGVRWSFANEMQRHKAFYFGHLPGFVPGVRLDVQIDDGSVDFESLFRRCEVAPVVG